MTIVEAGAALRAKKVSSVELTQGCLKKISELNPKLNAFITVLADSALARAHVLDEELAHGKDRGPMHGIPVAYKDLFETKGVRTTGGSKLFENFIPDRDADVVRILNDAGTVNLGKLGLHELAYGVTSNNPHFGAVRNPHDPERIPGGSSGGSGTAVQTGMALMAMGTDTGGSIRIPASYCGVAGLKPTYGLISKTGCLPTGYTLDTMGPLARTTRDAAIATSALSGRPIDARPGSAPPGGLKGMRVGIPTEFYFDRIDAEVLAAVRGAIDRARQLGATIVDVDLPHQRELLDTSRVMLLAEAADAVAEHWHERDKFGADVLALYDQGRLLRATDYVRTQRLRTRFTSEFLEAMTHCDVLLTPTTPITAPKIGQTTVPVAGADEDVRLASTRLVRTFNVVGAPALSVPCGKTSAGMPIGLQIVGRHFDEAAVCRAGEALESL